MTRTVGIALGGGGAKGLAHISMLEVFDDLGVTPTMISGTSIGAVIGSFYASGASAAEIRAMLDEFTVEPRSLFDFFDRDRPPHLYDLVDFDLLSGSSLLAVDKILAELEARLSVSTFEGLAIPLRVVAADFWGRTEVVLDAGPILPALAASFALPGVFEPVERDGLILIDGGSVNPVPYDLLSAHCDVTVAIDVMGKRSPPSDLAPSFSEVIFNSIQIASKTILREKMAAEPPTIYIDVGIRDVRVLEFNRADEIDAQAQPFKQQLRERLESLL